MRLLESTHEREQVFVDDFKEAVVLRERGALSEMAFTEAEIRYRESRKRVRTLELDALLARATLIKAVGVLSLDEIGPAREGVAPPGGATEPLGKKESQ